MAKADFSPQSQSAELNQHFNMNIYNTLQLNFKTAFHPTLTNVKRLLFSKNYSLPISMYENCTSQFLPTSVAMNNNINVKIKRHYSTNFLK